MATDHGFGFQFGDGVEFIDAQSDGYPAVHFTRAEFDAFIEGVRHGEFDVDEAEGGDEATEA
jgi:hypothetical protein